MLGPSAPPAQRHRALAAAGQRAVARAVRRRASRLPIVNDLDGSIGFVTPDNDACFNVAIRSLFIDRAGRARLGIGSGVVVDSDADAEFDECMLKARFVADAG